MKRSSARYARERLRKVEVKATGCHGFCEKGALVVIHPQEILYTQVKPLDVPEIVAKTIKKGEIVERLLFLDPATGKRVELEEEVPYYKQQMRLILGNNSRIDPADIRDYIALDGYEALRRVLEGGNPRAVDDDDNEIGASRTGRGRLSDGDQMGDRAQGHGASGATSSATRTRGIPARSWTGASARAIPTASSRESSSAPTRSARTRAIIYVRNEYPLAVEALTVGARAGARMRAPRRRHPRQRVLVRYLDFPGRRRVRLRRVDGAHGIPRRQGPASRARNTSTRSKRGSGSSRRCSTTSRPGRTCPRSSSAGVDWYTKIGTGDVSANPWGGSKGTKIFSLVGKVKNTGLVEVPMGTTLREIIFDIGGGVPKGKTFKAVQTGGPSGGCLPESLLDLPVDFDALTGAGSMMGSGGMIVMDEDTCMVDVARYFIDFLKDESCGKCLPCREGLRALLEILNRIVEGKGKKGDIAAPRGDLGRASRRPPSARSADRRRIRCSRRYAISGTSTRRIYRKKCPAGVCKPLLRFRVVPRALHRLPRVLQGMPRELHRGHGEGDARDRRNEMHRCGACFDACRFEAIAR